jgi:sugar/nucleoside kinase (ribokinase family)
MRQRIPTRCGLLAGGNWLIDYVKIVDVYPQPEQLGNILSQSEGTGGAPYNVLMDLARSGARFPLFGAGLLGGDARGRQILSDCRRHRIDTGYVGVTRRAPTSFTDVMTEEKTGRRTFFHDRGANALWRADDLDFRKISARIFHFGYFLLLDEMDRADARFGTRTARVLAAAQAAGLKTSVDAVTVDDDRLAKIAAPALKYTNYCVLNEWETGRITGKEIRRANGQLNTIALRRAADGLMRMGVQDLAVIHFPEGALARTFFGAEVWQPSLKLPRSYIAGTAGAGDAFCAGLLLGLHEGWDLRRCLLTGTCLAAASLSHPTTTGGVRSLRHSLALAKKFGFNPALE